jgi:5-deoxy-glucuronate isomerase
MDLRYHYTAQPGYTQLVAPATHPVAALDFGMLKLEGGQVCALETAEHEVGLVILTGTCGVQIGDDRIEALGGRASVFDGRATGVYTPCRTSVEINAGPQGVEIAVCRCPATASSASYPARVVRPDDVVAREVGGPGFRRYVHDIFGPQMQAQTLLVGETFTVEGNWSSFPPHKHDIEALPDEVRQEELYLYKIRPAGGFGIQYLYTPAGSPHGRLDQALAVREDDLTIMPYGYHPVAAPPGYDVYYLWFLAGRTRLMRPRDDPDHAWIKTQHEAPRSYPK